MLEIQWNEQCACMNWHSRFGQVVGVGVQSLCVVKWRKMVGNGLLLLLLASCTPQLCPQAVVLASPVLCVSPVTGLNMANSLLEVRCLEERKNKKKKTVQL